MTSMWLSLYAGFVARAAGHPLAGRGRSSCPAFEASHERMLRLFVSIATRCSSSASASATTSRCRRPRTFLTNYDSEQYNILIRARDYISFASMVLLAMAVVFELPLFVVGLTRIGILTTAQLRKNRRIGYFVVACIAVALPGIDPVTTIFETIPLLVLYEGSIWLSVLLDRRGAARARGVPPSST